MLATKQEQQSLTIECFESVFSEESSAISSHITSHRRNKLPAKLAQPSLHPNREQPHHQHCTSFQDASHIS
jgi:hypothetical protein